MNKPLPLPPPERIPVASSPGRNLNVSATFARTWDVREREE
jgi:hypothetical protein